MIFVPYIFSKWNFQVMFYHYHFHNRPHYTHQRKYKCNRLLGQCNFHRFDKGVWHIHQYLQKRCIIKIAKYMTYYVLHICHSAPIYVLKCVTLFKKLHNYHFHSWYHHIHQRRCKCDHLLYQCNFRRFDKGLRRIHRYLQKKILEWRLSNMWVIIHHIYVKIPKYRFWYW